LTGRGERFPTDRRIKDVARVANVSPATVSRVLSGRAVDPAMHERVMAAVRSTGYRPNLAARRLRSRHTNTIGLIVADIQSLLHRRLPRGGGHRL
jgi:LacI family fructose operon transcriptional repressor